MPQQHSEGSVSPQSFAMNSELVTPTMELRPEFQNMVAAYRSAGEARYQDVELDEVGFASYLQTLADSASGILPGPDLVPQTTCWLVNNGALIGIVRIRHHLSESLRIEGGHIGYDISPPFRNQGYGHKLLDLALEKALEIGIEQAMITCDSDNLPSRKIIERRGAVFDGESISPHSGKTVLRYWI